MKIILLHSEQVESSRAILAEIGSSPSGDDVTVTHEGKDIRIISNHALAVSVRPNFRAYPALMVQGEDGVVRIKSPVGSWSECVAFLAGTEPEVQAPAQVEFSKLEFLALFTDEEKISLKALEQTDPTVALFWEEYRTAQSIRLDDPRTIRAIEYLSAQGYLGEGRKESILEM